MSMTAPFTAIMLKLGLPSAELTAAAPRQRVRAVTPEPGRRLRSGQARAEIHAQLGRDLITRQRVPCLGLLVRRALRRPDLVTDRHDFVLSTCQ
jgi:hypothetical protein